MIARRLFTVFLLLVFLLPAGALAEKTLLDIRVEYMSDPYGTGVPEAVPAGPGDYRWDQNPDDPNNIRIIVLPTSAIAGYQVRVTAVYLEDGFETEYVFADPTAPDPEWINLEGSEFFASSYMLLHGNEYVPNDLTLMMLPESSLAALDPYVDPFADPNADPNVDPITDPNDDSYVDPNLDPNENPFGDYSDPFAPPAADPYIPPDPEPIVQLNPDPVVQTDPEPITQLNPDPVVQSDPEPITQLNPDPVVQSDTQPIANSQVLSAPASESALSSTLTTPTVDPNRPSDHGQIVTDSAFFYSASGDPILLPAGYVFDYYEDARNNYTIQYHDDTGNLWIPVMLPDGQQGYINQKDFVFITETEYAQAAALNQERQALANMPTEYAYTTQSGAQMVDRYGQPIRTLAPGVAVIHRTDWDAVAIGNRLYVPVTVDDGSVQPYYVPMSQLSFMSVADRDSYLSGQSVPEDPQTPAEVDPPTAPPVEEPDPQAPVITPDDPRHANIIRDGINVYQAPSTRGQIITQINASDVVQLLDTTTDSDGNTWYEVLLLSPTDARYMDRTGFIQYSASNESIRLMTADEQQRFENSRATIPPQLITSIPQVGPTSVIVTQAPTQTPIYVTIPPEATAYPDLPAKSGYMRVSAPQYAVLNAFPAYGAAAIGVLNRGEVVYVHAQMYDSDGNIWYQTQPSTSGATVGYTVSTDLTEMSAAEINAYFNNQSPTTPTSAPTAAPETFSGYGILTSASVRFRQTASMTGSVITQLQKNTIVRVVAQTTGDGYTWYKCESNGTTGYLRSDMLALLSIADYQRVTTSSSYDQNGNIITPTATANLGNGTVQTWATPRPGTNSQPTFVTLPPMNAGATASPDPSADPSASPAPEESPSADPSASPEATDPDGALLGDVEPSPTPDITLPPLDEEPTPPPANERDGFSASGLVIALIVLLVLLAGGFYGYSVYNKARRQRSEELARIAAEEVEEDDEQLAVRRPVPPTTPPGQPSPGQPRPGTPTGGQPGQAPRQSTPPGQRPPQGTQQGQRPAQPGSQQGQRPVQPGNQQSQRPAQPGSQQGQRPAQPGGVQQQRPGTAQANPYARPPQQQAPPPREQAVTSPLPRAQVDGKPVSPYAKPATPAQDQSPTQAQNGTNRQTAASGQMPASTDARRTQMPIAPPPVTPDDQAHATQDAESPTPRRRRRRPVEDTQNPEA